MPPAGEKTAPVASLSREPLASSTTEISRLLHNIIYFHFTRRRRTAWRNLALLIAITVPISAQKVPLDRIFISIRKLAGTVGLWYEASRRDEDECRVLDFHPAIFFYISRFSILPARLLDYSLARVSPRALI
jgi:hypothetical protein